jgi:hypothetical protein
MIAGYKPAYEHTVETMKIHCNRAVYAGGHTAFISFIAAASFVVAFSTAMFTVKCGIDVP